jgi:DNA invertase Pin-like site-specific DNA recombinase
MDKAVLYARVSTAKQLDGPSIEQQLAACRAYAEAHSMEVLATFSESGATMDRSRWP